MAATWLHSELGEFKYDGMGWVKIVNVPAFKSFAYDSGYRTASRTPGEHKLAFQADDVEDVPSLEAVALAGRVLSNHTDLVSKVTAALWDDFNGRGPDSGMWWHDDLGLVAEAMDAEEPPREADDLLNHLQLYCIRVRKSVGEQRRPLVELSFHADFEREHGVGVLTDGETVLGAGSSCDVMPFEGE
jgi:hypothetical protein